MVIRYKIGEKVLILCPRYDALEVPMGVNTDWWDLNCQRYDVGEVVGLKKDIELWDKRYFDLEVKVGNGSQKVPRYAVAPLRKIKEDITEWL